MDGSHPTPIAVPPPPPPAAGMKVLVVDDSAAQRRMMGVMLDRMGLSVVTAAGPLEALDLCRGPEGAQIGMVVSDWQMPGMDGPDFCRAFRAIAGDRYAYFILITAGGEKAGGLEAGADDYVQRPVDFAELRARVRAGLRMLAMQEKLLHRNHEVATTLHDLQVLQDLLSQDLVEARKLQRSFLPAATGTYGGSPLATRLITQGQVGGDLVGHFALPDDRLALYSFDVSGHGVASALMTGRLAGLYSTWKPRHNIVFPDPGAAPDPPEVVVARTNEFMLRSLGSDIYVTVALAYVDLATGVVEFCQAGHPHPMIRRADGAVALVGEGGPPVGLVEGMGFERTTCTLAPGDSLLLYSDGLTECTDTWGDMLEEEGLVDVVRGAGPDPVAALDHIETGLRDFTGIAGFDDDVSMVYFTFRPDGSRPDR
ncbi:fused response regulator/phosphatase [Jannaschia sp. LMIT008]|uniref:PP2C family protein-serine/threonine phosphatase n=1 Tax=Jannaschia maritima TaxID=3032585 RepID=UPI002811E13A|nr:fused response regulator/phosphatase [Jannaschia sp. LMIT008]